MVLPGWQSCTLQTDDSRLRCILVCWSCCSRLIRLNLFCHYLCLPFFFFFKDGILLFVHIFQTSLKIHIQLTVLFTTFSIFLSFELQIFDHDVTLSKCDQQVSDETITTEETDHKAIINQSKFQSFWVYLSFNVLFCSCSSDIRCNIIEIHCDHCFTSEHTEEIIQCDMKKCLIHTALRPVKLLDLFAGCVCWY